MKKTLAERSNQHCLGVAIYIAHADVCRLWQLIERSRTESDESESANEHLHSWDDPTVLPRLPGRLGSWSYCVCTKICLPRVTCHTSKNLRRKLSWHCKNPRNSSKFSPSKDFHYTVLYGDSKNNQ
jgi:hypothetical protein